MLPMLYAVSLLFRMGTYFVRIQSAPCRVIGDVCELKAGDLCAEELVDNLFRNIGGGSKRAATFDFDSVLSTNWFAKDLTNKMAQARGGLKLHASCTSCDS